MFRFGGFEATIDAYRIDIDDRIVLSENLNTPQVAALIAPFGATVARFFINGVETKTEGIDLVTRYLWRTESAGRFEFVAAGNWNDTEVEKVPSTNVIDNICVGQPAPCTPPVLFARINTLSFEEGTPDSKISLGVDWVMPLGDTNFGVNLKGTRYGEVVEPGVPIDGGNQRRCPGCTRPAHPGRLGRRSRAHRQTHGRQTRHRASAPTTVRPVSGPGAEQPRAAHSAGWHRESERHECTGVFALFTIRLQRTVPVTPGWPTTGRA